MKWVNFLCRRQVLWKPWRGRYFQSFVPGTFGNAAGLSEQIAPFLARISRTIFSFETQMCNTPIQQISDQIAFPRTQGNLTHHSLLINWPILVRPLGKLHPSFLVGNVMDTANPW